MAVSEAQKRASNKYNREHMATLGCKVKKEQAERFKQYAAEKGTTSNAMLSRYVLYCIGENDGKPAPDGTEREGNENAE
ncbi:MAG: hypothetical protein K2N60_00275 [Oscillospiraceae bacterium]|nr:hypothetical protein [Oscillospiraceae bacterium]